jgi:hypothetical protein
MAPAEALRALLDEDIERFNKESKRHKHLHRRAQTAIIVLTASTAIVAGAGLVIPDAGHTVQFIVLCLASTTTAVASWSEMRRARELWHHERMVYYALKDIAREVEFYDRVRTLRPDEVEAYFQRAISILGTSTHKWSEIQEQRIKEARQPPPGAGQEHPRAEKGEDEPGLVPIRREGAPR